jgi:hypothetical protein
MCICALSFSMSMYDIVDRIFYDFDYVTAGDYAIVGLICLVIGAGMHSSAKEKVNEGVQRVTE